MSTPVTSLRLCDDEAIDSLLSSFDDPFSSPSNLSQDHIDKSLESILQICNSAPSPQAVKALINLEKFFSHEKCLSRFRPNAKNLLRLNLPYYISSSNADLRTLALRVSVTLLTRFSSLQIDDITTDPVIQARILNYIAFDSRNFLVRQFEVLTQRYQLDNVPAENQSLDSIVSAAIDKAMEERCGSMKEELQELRGKVNQGKVSQNLIGDQNSEDFYKLVQSVNTLTSKVDHLSLEKDFKTHVSQEILNFKEEIADLKFRISNLEQNGGETSSGNGSQSPKCQKQDQKPKDSLGKSAVVELYVKGSQSPVTFSKKETEAAFNDLEKEMQEDSDKVIIEDQNSVESSQCITPFETPKVTNSRRSSVANQSNSNQTNQQSNSITIEEVNPSPIVKNSISSTDEVDVSDAEFRSKENSLTRSFDYLSGKVDNLFSDSEFKSKVMEDLLKLQDQVRICLTSIANHDNQFKVMTSDLTNSTSKVEKSSERSKLLQTRMTVLEDDVNTVGGKVRNLRDNIRKIGQRVDSFENLKMQFEVFQSGLASFRERVSQCESEVAHNSEILTELSQSNSSLCMNFDSIKSDWESVGDVVGLKSELEGIIPSVLKLFSKFEEFQIQVSETINPLLELKTQFSNHKATVSTEIQRLSDNLSDQSSTLQQLSTSVAESDCNQESLSNTISVLADSQQDLCNVVENVKELLTTELNSKLEVITDVSQSPQSRLQVLNWGFINRFLISIDVFQALLSKFNNLVRKDPVSPFRKLEIKHESHITEICSFFKENSLTIQEMEHDLQKEFIFYFSVLEAFLSVDSNVLFFLNEKYSKVIIQSINNCQDYVLLKYLLNVLKPLLRFDQSVEHLIQSGILLVLKEIFTRKSFVDFNCTEEDILLQGLIFLKSLAKYDFSIPYLLEFGLFDVVCSLCFESAVFKTCTHNYNINGYGVALCEALLLVLKCFGLHSEGRNAIIQADMIDFLISTARNGNEQLSNASISTLRALCKSYKVQCILKEKDALELVNLRYPLISSPKKT
ncbi:hypothetical protein P9112_000986 [Eukaryota sp. TZLM1-RC]